MRTVLLFLFFVVCIAGTSAQQIRLVGKIMDTVGRRWIPEASVLILHATDSFLVRDTRSNQDGVFNFDGIKPGQYILLITFPGYADYSEEFSIGDGDSVIDFGITFLVLKARLLEALVVKAKLTAIRIRGDTTEYRADMFHVAPNASVEDLIKSLPGLRVDDHGKITANGKPVNRVLVDGEEFFGDDPVLVTRNLRADMVDKVQSFEQSDRQSSFTRSGDGKKIQTLNLELKKDSKVGFFGKAEFGGGTQGFYQNQLLYNNFKDERKYSGYLMLSNTGNIGLDRSSQGTYADGDDIVVANDLDSWNGAYDGVGIPRSVSGGLHFNNKWNSDRQSFNGNFKVNSLNIRGSSDAITQTNLPADILYSRSIQKIQNHLMREGINAAYTILFDSSSSLKVYAEGALISKGVDEYDSSQTRSAHLQQLNGAVRTVSTDGSNHGFLADVLWQKKLKKPRRAIATNLYTKIKNGHSVGLFCTSANFFDGAGNIDSNLLTDQYKTADGELLSNGIKVTYTEPLDRVSTLTATFESEIGKAASSLSTFDRKTGTINHLIDSSYSNSYQINQYSHRGGFSWIANKNGLRVQFGGDLAISTLNQRNLFIASRIRRSFANWFPDAQVSYNFSSERSLSFRYNGFSTLPAIQQLQPVVNNKDPLFILVGNEKLRPTFTHNFTGSYYMFKGFTSLFADGRLSVITNPITTSAQIDGASGKSVYTYVNLTGKKTVNYRGSFMYRSRLKLWKLDWGVDGSIGGDQFANLSNGSVNVSNFVVYNLSLAVSMRRDSMFYVSLLAGPSYNLNRSSLQTSVRNDSWGYKLIPFVDVYLPFRIQVHTDGNYTWQGKTQTFTSDFNRFIWNASLAKRCFENGSLMLKVSANDILNQNVGFKRSASSDFIVQSTYSTVARYVMASVIWDFRKMGVRKK